MRTRTRHSRPSVKFNTTTGAKTFQNISIKIWDDIPEEIKQTQWINSVKKRFKSHFFASFKKTVGAIASAVMKKREGSH